MTTGIRKLIFDGGNTNIKARSDSAEISYPHALIELSAAQWKEIKTRSNSTPPPEYAEVNGKPYAFGQQAERYGHITRRTRAQKYTLDYYGVFMAYACARIWQHSGGDITVFASHAPGDIDYRDNLLDATGEHWQVMLEGRELNYRVVYANAFEEPLGGVMNLVLANDGEHLQHQKLVDERLLTFDIGGGTSDLFGVNPQGEPDYTVMHSEPVGINDVIEDFTRNLRSNNAQVFRSLAVIPPEQIRAALRTGVFNGGGLAIPCTHERDAAVMLLLNRLDTAYQRYAGGPMAWGAIVLTGGGPVDIEAQLRKLLNHPKIYMAEKNEYMHLANVRGGLKLCRMLAAGGNWYV